MVGVVVQLFPSMPESDARATVTLTREQWLRVAAAAIAQRMDGLRYGRRDTPGLARGDRIQHHADGLAAEAVVALLLGLAWAPHLGTFKAAGDLGQVEVRHTRRVDGCLILRAEDVATRPFVLVTGTPPTLTVRGWAWGHEVIRPEHWRTRVPSPAYFLPQSRLRPLSELPMDGDHGYR